MSEHVEQPEPLRSKPAMPATVPESTETSGDTETQSTDNGYAMPSENIFTIRTAGCDHSGTDIISEAAGNALKASRSGPDQPAPKGCTVAPPAVDWSSARPIATSPTGVMPGRPSFKPQFISSEFSPYQSAFSSSWGELSTSYNRLVAMYQPYKTSERSLAPIFEVGASSPLMAEFQGVDATRSFAGDKLKPSLTKIDGTKVSPALRHQIFKVQATIRQSENAIANSRNRISSATDEILKAAVAVHTAANLVQIEQVSEQIDELQLNKDKLRRNLDGFKAETKAIIESAKVVVSIINCLSDPEKIFGNIMGAVSQGMTAEGAVTDAAFTIDTNEKLAALDHQIGGLMAKKAALRIGVATDALQTALIGFRIAVTNAKPAMRSLDDARTAHNAAYLEMGVLIQKTGAASGLVPSDQKAVAGAVEAMPQIENILQELEGMEQGLTIPHYSEESGIGAGMASNLNVFTHGLSIIRGNQEYIAKQKSLWKARYASTLALIHQATVLGRRG